MLLYKLARLAELKKGVCLLLPQVFWSQSQWKRKKGKFEVLDIIFCLKSPEKETSKFSLCCRKCEIHAHKRARPFWFDLGGKIKLGFFSMFLGALCPGFKTLVGLPLGGLKKRGKGEKMKKVRKKSIG